jgi:hypothetical protein
MVRVRTKARLGPVRYCTDGDMVSKVGSGGGVRGRVASASTPGVIS